MLRNGVKGRRVIKKPVKRHMKDAVNNASEQMKLREELSSGFETHNNQVLWSHFRITL